MIENADLLENFYEQAVVIWGDSYTYFYPRWIASFWFFSSFCHLREIPVYMQCINIHSLDWYKIIQIASQLLNSALK
jgi:hypothetical protein